MLSWENDVDCKSLWVIWVKWVFECFFVFGNDFYFLGVYVIDMLFVIRVNIVN